MFLNNKTLGKRGTKCQKILKNGYLIAKKVSRFCYNFKKVKDTLKPKGRTFPDRAQFSKLGSKTSTPQYSRFPRVLFYLFYLKKQCCTVFLALQRQSRIVRPLPTLLTFRGKPLANP